MNVKIKNISIPYGAIKRNKATKKMDNINNISIPYGAIKSVKRILDKGFEKIFQFLMVRLKDTRNKWRGHIIFISIPYGAIKSMQLMASRQERT